MAAKFTAILVEDEPSAARQTEAALVAAGFTVHVRETAVSALEEPPADDEIIDLVVLDRRLPRAPGDPPIEKVGDDLLVEMLRRYPDVVFVVFSGRTGFLHQQSATSDRGMVETGQDWPTFDRVRVFEKAQTLEFDDFLAGLSRVLTSLDDIEVRPNDGISNWNRRMLRRVTAEFGGVSVQAKVLRGGRSESPVWLCSILARTGPRAHVVAKVQSSEVPNGGFADLCGPHLTASRIATVRGLCGGATVTVQQLVDADPVSTFDLLHADPEQAEVIARKLVEGLARIPSGHEEHLPLEEVCLPFGRWDSLQTRAREFAIPMPPGSRIATTARSHLHGDLHPGNLLALDGSPVLIDFDSQTRGSELVDMLALSLGAILHEDSPLRDDPWPTVAQCSQFPRGEFYAGCPASGFFHQLQARIDSCARSERELAGLVLAFCLRQLKFDGVRDHELQTSRAIALARWASAQLL